MTARGQKNRLQKVIKKDRMGATDSAIAVISNDIQRVLKNYFSLKNDINLKIEVSSKGYLIRAEAQADAFKNFTCSEDL